MSSPTTTTSSQGTAGSAPSPHQERLISFCREQGSRAPNFQIVSDRRGGRTAWSCVVTVQGAQVPARFWYDGQYVHSAREDAAEKALQMLGVYTNVPQSQPPAHLRQGAQHQHQHQQHQYQHQQHHQKYHGMINS